MKTIKKIEKWAIKELSPKERNILLEMLADTLDEATEIITGLHKLIKRQ